jgi:hypothetical protein
MTPDLMIEYAKKSDIDPVEFGHLGETLRGVKSPAC